MKSFFSRVQRELPDTDKDRYDIAYERGRAQSRSSLLFGGLALGALSGLIGMFILDPARGAQRRADIAARVGGLRGQVATATRSASRKATDLSGKAKEAVGDRGITSAPASSGNPEPSFATGPVPATRVEPPTRAETVGAASTAVAAAPPDEANGVGMDAGAQPAPSGVDAPGDVALTGPAGIVASPDFERPHPGGPDLGPDAPGVDVADPLTPEELEAFGPSGPVAGAATNSGGGDQA